MFYKLVDFYIFIINQIRRTYAYIEILLKNYPKLISYFYSYIVLWAMLHIQMVSFSDSERFEQPMHVLWVWHSLFFISTTWQWTGMVYASQRTPDYVCGSCGTPISTPYQWCWYWSVTTPTNIVGSPFTI